MFESVVSSDTMSFLSDGPNNAHEAYLGIAKNEHSVFDYKFRGFIYSFTF